MPMVVPANEEGRYMDENIFETEKRLLRIVDQVLEEYKPLISELCYDLERSDEIDRSSSCKSFTSVT